ncbi:MAG: cytidine deaminase [Oligoflexia bacterium]|nr:cytidine deaminase [Oligoflexia bacterium]
MNDRNLNKAYDLAKEVREKAYARYSGYKVGCAIVLNNGEIVTGCNVENASYGATVCAERNAIFSVIAKHGSCEAAYLVLVTKTEASPCGMCLQVMSEFFPADFPIYVADEKKILGKKLLKDFLPLPFQKENLSKHGSH